MTTTPAAEPAGGRTAAATAAATAKRLRRSQEASAKRLATAGWVSFPPEKVKYLEAFIRAHQGDGCDPTPAPEPWGTEE